MWDLPRRARRKARARRRARARARRRSNWCCLRFRRTNQRTMCQATDHLCFVGLGGWCWAATCTCRCRRRGQHLLCEAIKSTSALNCQCVSPARGPALRGGRDAENENPLAPVTRHPLLLLIAYKTTYKTPFCQCAVCTRHLKCSKMLPATAQPQPPSARNCP
jgi:hypothetical protein